MKASICIRKRWNLKVQFDVTKNICDVILTTLTITNIQIVIQVTFINLDSRILIIKNHCPSDDRSLYFSSFSSFCDLCIEDI